MGTLGRNDDRALEEAAGWFMQLSQSKVTEKAIDEFFDWRAKPGNGAAYAEVERRMRQTDQLRNDPELVQMTEALLRRPDRQAQRRTALRRWAAPIGLVGLAAAAAVLVLSPALRAPTYATEVGAQQVVRLEDGSVVRLNTDSKVQVRYSQGARRLVLERGQAYFEVAHDETRPFVVEAGDARVSALGTKFDVRREVGQTQVTLVEGRVEVARAGQQNTWALRPREQITLDGGEPLPHPANVAQATSWTTGRLSFLDTPLASAVEEVNRYSRTKIVLEAGDIGHVRVNGAFETGDTAAFVSAVTELFDLTAVKSRGAIMLRAGADTRS